MKFNIELKSDESFPVFVTWCSDLYSHHSTPMKNPNKFLMEYYQISLMATMSNGIRNNKGD